MASRTSLLARLTPVAVVAAAALGACGSPSAEDQVRDSLNAALTGTHGHGCDQMTPSFLAATSGLKPAAAVKQCKRSPLAYATTVDVADVNVEGDTATARLRAHEGDYDGQEIKVALRKVDGGWKLDEVTDARMVDRRAAEKALVVKLADGMDRKMASCIVGELRTAGDAAMGKLVTDGNEAITGAPMLRCALRDEGRSTTTIDCVMDRIGGRFEASKLSGMINRDSRDLENALASGLDACSA